MGGHEERLSQLGGYAKAILGIIVLDLFLDVMANFLADRMVPFSTSRLVKGLSFVLPTALVTLWFLLRGRAGERAAAWLLALLGTVIAVAVYLLDPPFRDEIPWIFFLLANLSTAILVLISSRLGGAYIFFRPLLLFLVILLWSGPRLWPASAPQPMLPSCTSYGALVECVDHLAPIFANKPGPRGDNGPRHPSESDSVPREPPIQLSPPALYIPPLENPPVAEPAPAPTRGKCEGLPKPIGPHPNANYTVMQGDNLSDIAEALGEYEASFIKEIIVENDDYYPSLAVNRHCIVPGWELYIPQR